MKSVNVATGKVGFGSSRPMDLAPTALEVLIPVPEHRVQSESEVAHCDYCGKEVKPATRGADGHICKVCIVDIQIAERTEIENE